MPTYTFQCRECGELQIEVLGADEVKPEQCKFCGGELARKYDPPAIHFRGAGFYSTDKVLSDPIDPLDYDPMVD